LLDVAASDPVACFAAPLTTDCERRNNRGVSTQRVSSLSRRPTSTHTSPSTPESLAFRPSRPARSKRPRLPSPRFITRAHARRPNAPWRSPFSPLRRAHPPRLTSVSSRRHAPGTRSRVQRPSWNFPRASPSVRNTRAFRAVARARARFTRRARRTVRLARRHGLARLALGRARHRAPRALECAASNVPPNPTSRSEPYLGPRRRDTGVWVSHYGICIGGS